MAGNLEKKKYIQYKTPQKRSELVDINDTHAE